MGEGKTCGIYDVATGGREMRMRLTGDLLLIYTNCEKLADFHRIASKSPVIICVHPERARRCIECNIKSIKGVFLLSHVYLDPNHLPNTCQYTPHLTNYLLQN